MSKKRTLISLMSVALFLSLVFVFFRPEIYHDKYGFAVETTRFDLVVSNQYNQFNMKETEIIFVYFDLFNNSHDVEITLGN